MSTSGLHVHITTNYILGRENTLPDTATKLLETDLREFEKQNKTKQTFEHVFVYVWDQ